MSGCLGLSFRAAALLDAGPAEKGRRQPQHGVARAPCCQAPSPACLNAAGPCFWPVSLPSITPPPASSSFLSSVLVLMRSLEEVSLENEAGLCEPKEPDVSQQQSSKPTHSHFRSLSEASHLLAQLLLCCFPPSARKTSFCASFPPSGLSTEGFFFLQCHQFFAVDVFKEAQREKKMDCAESGNVWAKELVLLLWEGCPTCMCGRGHTKHGNRSRAAPPAAQVIRARGKNESRRGSGV